MNMSRRRNLGTNVYVGRSRQFYIPYRRSGEPTSQTPIWDEDLLFSQYADDEANGAFGEEETLIEEAEN